MSYASKRMALLAIPLLLASSNGLTRDFEDRATPRQVKPNWENKKCKSCAHFPCGHTQHTWRAKPLGKACEKYLKRKSKK